MVMGSSLLELSLGIPNIDRKGFGEAKSKLPKQVFVRGRSSVGTVEEQRRNKGTVVEWRKVEQMIWLV